MQTRLSATRISVRVWWSLCGPYSRMWPAQKCAIFYNTFFKKMHTYTIMLIAAQMLNYFRLHGCKGVTFPQWLSNFLLHTSIAVCVYDQPHGPFTVEVYIQKVLGFVCNNWYDAHQPCSGLVTQGIKPYLHSSPYFQFSFHQFLGKVW